MLNLIQHLIFKEAEIEIDFEDEIKSILVPVSKRLVSSKTNSKTTLPTYSAIAL